MFEAPEDSHELYSLLKIRTDNVKLDAFNVVIVVVDDDDSYSDYDDSNRHYSYYYYNIGYNYVSLNCYQIATHLQRERKIL